MPVPVANVLAEIRAFTRDGLMPAPMIGELHRRLEEVRDPLQGSTVIAMALLASARGEARHARELMESVWWLDKAAHAPGTLEYALGWLVTDAAAEGEWKRVLSFVAEAPESSTMRLFAHLAGRVLKTNPKALASDDWYQLPAEARAFVESFAPQPASAPRATVEGDELAKVLQLLLRRDELHATAKAASALLSSPRLRDRLMERAILIGGSSPDEALQELRAIFEESLGDALFEAGVGDPLLSRVASEKREALVEKLHQRIDRLTDLCSEGRAPPMPEVWREFVAIRGIYTRAVALSQPNDRGWPHHVLLRLTRYFGTWLRLTKKELPFAHAVFKFLEAEGRRAGDDAAAQLAKATSELCVPFQLTRS
jgi:hypothetical protein